MMSGQIRAKVMLLAAVMLVVLCAPAARGVLFLRYTFNEHVPGEDPNDAKVDNSGHTNAMEGHDATVYSGDFQETFPTYVSSPGGTALHLDGSQDQFILLNGLAGGVLPVTLVDDTGASFAFWLKADISSDSYTSLLTTSGESSTTELMIFLKYPLVGGAPYTQRRFQSPYHTPIDSYADDVLIDTGQWYHLVLTVEGDQYVAGSQTLRFYINGVLKHTATGATCRPGLGTASRIGATWHNTGHYYQHKFTGDLDQVDIYDHLLTDDDVTALYEAGPLYPVSGHEYIRTNPPFLGGQLISQDPNYTGVVDSDDVADYMAAGFTYFSYFDPFDRDRLDLAKALDPNYGAFLWSLGDQYLRTFRDAYAASAPTIIMRGDEPHRDKFTQWSTQTKFIRNHYPEYLVFTNANPSTANSGDATYMQDFVDAVKPDVLMSDRYPLSNNGTTDFGYYFDILSEMRKVGVSNNLPLWMWIQSETWVPDYIAINGRLPSETDLRMLMFSAMSFGFTGFNFLSYAHWIVPALINPDGTKTHVYQSAVNTNPEVLSLLYILRFAKSNGIFYVPGQAGNTVPTYNGPIDLDVWSDGADPDSHILDVSIDENATLINGLIGFFTADNGEEYFMNCNLFSGPGLTPVDAEVTFRVQFDASVSSLLRINRLTGDQEVVSLTSNELVDVLPGGTGNLYKYNNGVDFVTSWDGAPTSCQQAIFQGYGLTMDFDGNCRVGMEDLAVFIRDWLYCVAPNVAGCDTPWL